MLDPSVLGFDLELVHFDLSLANRRATANAVVRDAAAAMRETGLGLKAATITPETTGDVGSPNRILREGVGGSVIVRTGRRIPGVSPPAAVVHPIVVVRMAVGDAYGAEERRTGEPGTRPSRRGAPSGSTAPSAGPWRNTRSARRPARRLRLRRTEVDRVDGLRGDAQGGDGRCSGPASGRAVPAHTDRRRVRRAAHRVQHASRWSSPRSTATGTASRISCWPCSAPSPAQSRCSWRSTTPCARWSPWPRRRTAPRRRCWARTWPTPWRCSWPAPPCSTMPRTGDEAVAAGGGRHPPGHAGRGGRRDPDLRPGR